MMQDLKTGAPRGAGFGPREALTLLFLLALTAVVYSQYSFEGALSRDSAIYLYSGQKMAEGIPPYVSIFDHKGPLTPMLTGGGVMLSELLGTADVTTARTLFFALGCLAVLSAYLLGRQLFASHRAGVFTSLTFLGFFCFARYAISEPEAKTPMILFQILALLFTSRKRWFAAGACGSLAALVWQPMVVFLLVTLLLAAAEARALRLAALLRAVSGATLPVAAVLAYFYRHGALYELANGTVLFNLRHLDGEHFIAASLAYRVAETIFVGYTTVLVPVVLSAMVAIALVGFAMLGRLYFSALRRAVSRALGVKTTLESPFAPVLLSFPFPVAWSLMDFQGYPDFYVFVPFVALGFGGFLDRAVGRLEGVGSAIPAVAGKALAASLYTVLGAVAVVSSLVIVHPAAQASSLATSEKGPRPADIHYQSFYAQEIRERHGEDARIVSVGAPEVLVLLQETNPTPYAFVIRGIDREIAATTPGGFEGWLSQLEAHDPDVIAVGETSGRYEDELFDWLEANYEREKVGPWFLYVKEPSSAPEPPKPAPEDDAPAGETLEQPATNPRSDTPQVPGLLPAGAAQDSRP